MKIKHERLSKVLLKMNTRENLHFYSFILSYIKFVEDRSVPTAYATIRDLKPVIGYNPTFLDSLNDLELVFLMIHELMHLVSNHLRRGANSLYDKGLANIAMDMIINSNLINTYCKGLSTDLMKMPGMGCTMDKNYKGNWIFEELYLWLVDKKKENDEKGKASGVEKSTQDLLDNLSESGGETLDSHKPISVEDAEMLDQIMDKLTTVYKSRNDLHSDTSSLLEVMVKKRRSNNLRYLKRVISTFKSQIKEKTWTRFNRRGVQLAKGFKKTGQEIVVGLDVSGSMSNDFEIVLGELFKDNFAITILQCDTSIKHVDRITSKEELKQYKIHGLGGTTLQPAIDFVKDPSNKLNKYPLCILTDGYTDNLDFSGLKHRSLILTTEQECPVKAGKVKQIKLNLK